MGNALISQRSSRYTTIKFENYGTGPTLSKGTATSLSFVISGAASTTVGNYALFGGGNTFTCYADVDVYEIKNLVLQATVYKGAKHKFQNMDEEATVTSNMEVLSIPTPATGYIKFKNATIS